MTSCKEVHVKGIEGERGVWDKAREKKISKTVRGQGMTLGTGRSLLIGNSSSGQAAEKKEIRMQARDRNLGWADQEKLPEEETYEVQGMGSQEQKTMPP